VRRIAQLLEDERVEYALIGGYALAPRPSGARFRRATEFRQGTLRRDQPPFSTGLSALSQPRMPAGMMNTFE
jgi:hypothetical protein